ncbi:DUF4292 domain-containing protein [Pedobacter sp. LMG 31464]|uniref:DUF4292 domain-containing protein n=1 Tax=Pedobacter planticolens TaxID=2679964 RepID=A0A923DZA8_9SPHI|nr:DUF4292 domain-containing protein [Pedobacter planticolens]MBB2145870.1 DUF4292 domain-containing protein [Pedobacter planticolens]
MKRSILNSLLLAVLVVMGIGCRPKKVIITTPPIGQTTGELKVDKKPENLELLKSKDLPFNTLALRGKADLDINGDENNVTMIIRIQKDKKIWVSVTAIAGIEVARAVITPDSLLLLDRLHKKFTKKPFSYIYNYTNKQINFGLLQSVFSGNTIKDFMVEKSALVQENGVWVLSGTADDLAYRSLFNTLLKVQETSLNDAKAAQAFKVTYGNYTPVNNALFPSSLKINSMSGDKKINVNIDFIKIESNTPVDFPFTVPKSFEVIN